MDGNKRRESILKQLSNAQKPISASFLAKLLGVSRQIIVGDIALLRASGHEIVATARGYLFSDRKQLGVCTKIACQHSVEQTEEELLLIVSLGGEILDVIVEHPLYGEISGNLQLKTTNDVLQFTKKVQESDAFLLASLTGGIHLHTICCKDEMTIQTIKQALSEKSLLYENN